MKEYTSSSPVFSESIEIPEATDTNHVNNLNPAPMQLLQNTLLNRKAIENIVNDIASSADAVYQQATGYTDTKIAELINGAPSTLDTLGEIAQAMQDNDNVVDALEAAIGNKAPQAELDGHTGNSTIHITASERTNWDSHMSEKATANSFGHVKLSDTFQNALEDGDAANGVGASQKALADAYSALNSNLADSLGGLTFGVDSDGNPGYIKAGADTVTPFKSKKTEFRWSSNYLSGFLNFSNPGEITFETLTSTNNSLRINVYGTMDEEHLDNYNVSNSLLGYFNTGAVGNKKTINTGTEYPYIIIHCVYDVSTGTGTRGYVKVSM